MSSGKRTLAPKRNCGEGGQAPSLRQYKNSTNNGGSIPSKLELEEMILDSLKIIAWVTAFAFALMLKGMALLEFTNFVQRRQEIVGRRFRHISARGCFVAFRQSWRGLQNAFQETVGLQN